VEELLHNIQREESLENRKRCFNNLETMERALKELLYDDPKGVIKSAQYCIRCLIFPHWRLEMGGHTQASTSCYNF
jgi:hypothetical protein